MKPNQTVTTEHYQQLIDLTRVLNQKRPIIAQTSMKNLTPNCAPSDYFDRWFWHDFTDQYFKTYLKKMA